MRRPAGLLREAKVRGCLECMDSLLPAPIARNGDLISDIPDPVHVTISQAAADHIANSWSVDQRIQAVHEGGHACLSAVLSIPIDSASLKGRHGGRVTTSIADDNRPELLTDTIVRSMITIAMAGLAAEIELLGEGTIGNDHDLMTASNYAIMRLNNGLDPDFPPINLGAFGYGQVAQNLTNLHAKLVVAELVRARKEAERLVAEHRGSILTFARIIYEARRLDGDALDAALRRAGLSPAPRGA